VFDLANSPVPKRSRTASYSAVLVGPSHEGAYGMLSAVAERERGLTDPCSGGEVAEASSPASDRKAGADSLVSAVWPPPGGPCQCEARLFRNGDAHTGASWDGH